MLGKGGREDHLGHRRGQSLQELESVRSRHVNIEKEEVGSESLDRGDGFIHAGCLSDDGYAGMGFEHAPEFRSGQTFIVNDKGIHDGPRLVQLLWDCKPLIPSGRPFFPGVHPPNPFQNVSEESSIAVTPQLRAAQRWNIVWVVPILALLIDEGGLERVCVESCYGYTAPLTRNAEGLAAAPEARKAPMRSLLDPGVSGVPWACATAAARVRDEAKAPSSLEPALKECDSCLCWIARAACGAIGGGRPLRN